MTENNVVKITHSIKVKEMLSDIAYCLSVFNKFTYNMEDNFMNPEVVHAYQLANMIRIKAKNCCDELNIVYQSSVEVLSLYGDLLYGRDVRASQWRIDRLVEYGYVVTKKVVNK